MSLLPPPLLLLMLLMLLLLPKEQLPAMHAQPQVCIQP